MNPNDVIEVEAENVTDTEGAVEAEVQEELPELFTLRAEYKGAEFEVVVRSKADAYDAARGLLAMANNGGYMTNLLATLDPVRLASDLGASYEDIYEDDEDI